MPYSYGPQVPGSVTIPIPLHKQEDNNMATSETLQYDVEAGWHQRAVIAADAAQQARDMVVVYVDDARRAYQYRMDNISMTDAVANQTQSTSRVALEALQMKSPLNYPPYPPAAPS